MNWVRDARKICRQLMNLVSFIHLSFMFPLVVLFFHLAFSWMIDTKESILEDTIGFKRVRK
ncbi:unnamed protein product [Onchocerca flexuosa]|uniref:Uncharacterized protein n=1 Tax=Onchocerca flexuosa TaxID=387005 RepID=A0A183HNA7_9BILA|nr:unnamed protein product [Onchocerca flexuosa]